GFSPYRQDTLGRVRVHINNQEPELARARDFDVDGNAISAHTAAVEQVERRRRKFPDHLLRCALQKAGQRVTVDQLERLQRGRLAGPVRENLIAYWAAETASERARREAPLAGARGSLGLRRHQGAPLAGYRAERIDELLAGDPAHGWAMEHVLAFVLRIAAEGGRLIGA